jgi:AcrR family transcriptional regulator
VTTAAQAPTPTADPAPRSARRAQTRERLMAAATAVFAERGVIGASVEEICEAAGFTRGAFYSNFADKDSLVLALIEAGVAAQYTAAERAVDELRSLSGSRSPAELVSQTLTRFEAMGQPSRESVLAQHELMLHAARVPALQAAYTAFQEVCATRLHDLIGDALQVAGLEFVLPFDQALELLVATHDHVQAQLLFRATTDSSPLQTLIMAITRPVTGTGPAASGDPNDLTTGQVSLG